ncbi:Defensin-5 [Sciurus carolinensis]|uniref:Defensin-5 n=1 Tax=Sciurus carolinensis TaxID=30640 RepID=A0AA41TB90_SCICA|nr:Defensin-5 [Sciurus carolinensis]
MRTLALLTALLLLALQAQAQPLSERNEEAPDQEQSGEENQDVEISFAGAAASALREAGERPQHATGMEGPEGGLQAGGEGVSMSTSPPGLHPTCLKLDSLLNQRQRGK